VHHITKIWGLACREAGLDPEEVQLPEGFLTEVLVVLRLLLCTPWRWNEHQADKQIPTASSTSPSRSPIQPHQIPHLRGHVSVLQAMLTAMSATISWLPNVLAYVFPPGKRFTESPLFSEGVLVEADGPEGDEDEEAEGTGTPSSELNTIDPPFSVPPAPMSVTPTRSRAASSSAAAARVHQIPSNRPAGHLNGPVSSAMASTSPAQGIASGDEEGGSSGYVVVYRPSLLARWIISCLRGRHPRFSE